MSNFTKILETLNESKNEYEIKYVDENTIQIYKLTGDYFDITAAKEGDTLSIGKKYTTVKFKPGKEIEINSPTESIDLGMDEKGNFYLYGDEKHKMKDLKTAVQELNKQNYGWI